MLGEVELVGGLRRRRAPRRRRRRRRAARSARAGRCTAAIASAAGGVAVDRHGDARHRRRRRDVDARLAVVRVARQRASRRRATAARSVRRPLALHRRPRPSRCPAGRTRSSIASYAARVWKDSGSVADARAAGLDRRRTAPPARRAPRRPPTRLTTGRRSATRGHARPQPAAGAAPEQRHAQALDAVAEHGERRRQQRQRGEHRHQHDGDGARRRSSGRSSAARGTCRPARARPSRPRTGPRGSPWRPRRRPRPRATRPARRSSRKRETTNSE